jgi:hypothetical protein
VTTTADCQNCGAALAGTYCSACGQKADVRIPSLGALLADAFGDLFNFDSRIWRSLATLALKPGRLTRSYLEGRRARHTPPFRMYVVTSVMFFLVFSLVRTLDPPAESAAAAADDVAAVPGAPALPQPNSDEAAESSQVHITVEDGEWSCNLIDRDVPLRLRRRLEAACAEIQGDNTSYARAFGDNVPVMMLVFIPIVAGIMRLLYLFARRKYVEHLLFFLHVHTFFFFTAIVTLILSLGLALPLLQWPLRIVIFAAWFYFPVYLYLAMRHVYAQGHLLTAVKYVVLGGSYVIAFVYTLVITIVITAVMV